MLLSFMMLLSFIGSASAFAASPEDPPPVGPLEISLSSGDVVQGYTQKSVNLTKAFVRSFRGIKFGSASRWMPPNFTAFHQYMSKDGSPINGPACPWITNMNDASSNIALAFDYATSEDCLNLNVFTPVSKPKEPLPVVIWLHGGSNGVTGPACLTNTAAAPSHTLSSPSPPSVTAAAPSHTLPHPHPQSLGARRPTAPSSGSSTAWRTA